MYEEKTNKELILEILEESGGTIKENEVNFDTEDTIKNEIVEIAKGLKREEPKEDSADLFPLKEESEKSKEGGPDTKNIVKYDSHYRLKMELINNYTWANLSKPAKALLVVIGCFQNKHTGACYLARGTMARYTGYSDSTIGEALKELVVKGLLTKKEAWRCNDYFLTTKTKWIEAIDEGTTYFRLFRYQVEASIWARLTRSEKAVYPVLYVKGTINYSFDTTDGLDISCIGEIKSVKEFIDWAGISRPTFRTVMDGLEAKSLIEVFPDNTYWLFSLDRLLN
ncbi:hypothetical protein ES705_27526 [subsurface metagenome]